MFSAYYALTLLAKVVVCLAGDQITLCMDNRLEGKPFVTENKNKVLALKHYQ